MFSSPSASNRVGGEFNLGVACPSFQGSDGAQPKGLVRGGLRGVGGAPMRPARRCPLPFTAPGAAEATNRDGMGDPPRSGGQKRAAESARGAIAFVFRAPRGQLQGATLKTDAAASARRSNAADGPAPPKHGCDGISGRLHHGTAWVDAQLGPANKPWAEPRRSPGTTGTRAIDFPSHYPRPVNRCRRRRRPSRSCSRSEPGA